MPYWLEEEEESFFFDGGLIDAEIEHIRAGKWFSENEDGKGGRTWKEKQFILEWVVFDWEQAK